MRFGHLRWCSRHHRFPRHGSIHPISTFSGSSKHNSASAEKGWQLRGKDLQRLRNLLPLFTVQAILPRNSHLQVKIYTFRPNSSRESSAEHFLVGLNFHKDPEVDKVELSTFFREVKQESMLPQEEKIFKFVTCGDLSGFDPIQESVE
jgi:hypothetical protein